MNSTLNAWVSVSDPDFDPLTVTAMSSTSNGTVTMWTNGGFTYVPNANFVGTDSFTFNANDGSADSTTETVTINVTNNAPTASSSNETVHMNSTLTAWAVVSDPDGDQTWASVVSSTTNGTLTMWSNGGFNYLPNANFVGTDSFTFKANDGAADSSIETVTINVTNNAPSASSSNETVHMNSTLTAWAVVSDPDGDQIWVSVVSTPSNGTVTMWTNGGFTYMPNTNFVGTDSFTIQATDGAADSSVETVTINVTNDAPTATASSESVHMNSTLSSSVSVSDPNYDPLTVSVVSPAANGTVTMWSSGYFTYAPNTNFVGTDSFTFKANDGAADSSTETVTITVNNDPPISNAGSASIDMNATLSGTLSISDPDYDPLTVIVVTAPANGAVTTSLNGSFTYVPNTNFFGTDSFDFKANDGAADSNISTYTIAVNRPEVTLFSYDPDAAEGFDDVNDAFDVTEDTAWITLVRTGNTSAPLTVSVALSGTALPSDYIFSTPLTIPAGWLSQSFVLTPTQDNDFLEGDETVIVTATATATSPYTLAAVNSATITIKDVNRTPNVGDKTLHLPNNATGVIYNVGATDPDAGQTLTYQLFETGNASATIPFSIDASGNISVSGVLAVQLYSLTVRVTDNGTPTKSDTGAITIEVHDFFAFPTEVDYLQDHTIWIDPSTTVAPGTAYPEVEWVLPPAVGPAAPTDPVAYTSGFGTTKKLLTVSAKFKVSNNWAYQGATTIRATVTDGYNLSQTNADWFPGDATSDLLTITSAVAVKNFENGARYYPNFQISWELNYGGTVWVSIGSTFNPMYLTWKNPIDTSFYRTVLHIGSTNIQARLPVVQQTPNNVFGAMWEEFTDLNVTRWDGGAALIYNHATEAALDIPFVPDNATPSNTEELLTYGHGQCDSWADFLLTVSAAQGLSGATEGMIVASQGDGFYVKNMDWKTPNPGDIQADGFNWRPVGIPGSPRTVSKGVGIAGQGAGVPDQVFKYHKVVKFNGEIFDPSYGINKADLAAWEEAAIDGLWKVSLLGTEYAKKRSPGDSFVEWD